MPHHAATAFVDMLATRFTCKRYDPAGHVPDEDFAQILEAARLSPSSFGLEPWKLLVIENPELLAGILERAWGAKRNADRTVVILARRDATAEGEWANHIARDVQGLSEEDMAKRLSVLGGFQANDLHVLDNERTLFDWASKQTYIALANMLSTAALLGVDATPVEGYSADKLEELFASKGLYDPAEWGVSVLAQFGVRDPSHFEPHKTRRPLDEVVEYVR